jgi:glycogen operon protein
MHGNGGQQQDNYVYVAMNMHWETHLFELPELPQRMQWHVFANTIMPHPEDIWKPGSEPLLEDQQQFLVGSRSVVILVGK